MRSDRRIDPDVNLDQDEQLERLTKLAMEAAARATVSIHGYSEGDKGTRSWIVGVGSTLLVAFILGGWTLSNQTTDSFYWEASGY